MPKVSVIMPVYNGIRFLERAISSILNQTEKDFEFIIIDDGSTEPVWKMISSFSDSRIKACKDEVNRGLTFQLNRCLDLATGIFIMRMDADDVSLPSRMERQLSKFDSGVGFVGCWGRSINEEGKSITRYVDVNCRCSDKDLKTIYPKKVCMIDPSVMYSREAVKKVGYFDVKFLTGQTYNYTRRVQQFFKGRVVQEILYLRTVRHDSVMRKSISTIDVIGLANERAKKYPIIKDFD